MAKAQINTTVLMSGPDYFSDEFAINPYMDAAVPISLKNAVQEHAQIKSALEDAGVNVIKVDPPKNCQDGVYTANWGLCRCNKVILSSLPNKRKEEESYAEAILTELGMHIFKAPYIFSGQGDALPCGNLLFAGSTYRTDPRMHQFISENLGFEVISLQTIPLLNANDQVAINAITGWPDSFFYDIDLALSVITPDLIAWCPEAFTIESQERIRSINIEKIEVSFQEATKGFACNLVSTGETVIMSNHAPELKKELTHRGFKVVCPPITELAKGGGYIRCTTLTIA